MTLAKYSARKIKIILQKMEKNKVIQKPVPIKRRYFFGESECSDIYFVIPAFMPPFEILWIIVEKLVNCPRRAIPTGPIIAATTFTLISAVNILTNADTAFKEETLIKSVNNKRLILVKIILK